MSENTDYETLKAERDAALNTCSLIAESLGITGAVAGDTIARVQQLIGENAVMLKLLTDISENHSEFVDEGEDCMCASIPLDYVSEINMYVSRDVNAENPFIATDKALNEIKAQGVEMFSEFCKQKAEARAYTFFTDAGNTADEFAASLRGE
ncbi:hypothetical protein [Yersinia pseudotuberculosis]|uniref:hypothetical protein n=1 Tax=Yersinia pseudotuberculosis TaxID=633 RepID=UPI0005E710DF|nr:hypothetical protein [Yersinia pseudotuberculosis]CND51646.1 Uncharacterised protein [Yersinia pseudotuberculosis]